MFSRLQLSPALFAAVVAHARRELPNECCGLLAGRVAEGAAAATLWRPVGNDAAGPTAYETNPRDMLVAFRAIRAAGLELLAVVHSHPTSAPVPSRRDLDRNTYGETVVHLIVGLAGAAPEVRGWWLSATDYREALVEIAEI